MKREDVKAKFPNMTDEEIKWLMDEHGKGITREKTAAAAIQTQLDTANAQLKTAQEGLAAFDGVDVKSLQGQIATLQQQMKDQADQFAFDGALDTAIRTANGKNIKAIRGMLDIEALKASTNRDADIKTALDALGKAEPWAFGAAAPAASGVTVVTGGEHGQGGSGAEVDGVEAAFKKLNPGLNF